MPKNLNMRFRYLIYLILLIIPFVFRDYSPANELKYISIIKEALNNNTWFTFYNHGEIYADKPPLFFWLLMLSKIITHGYYMWIFGLFSLLPAIGTIAIMDKWMKTGKVVYNPLTANLMLLTTVMFLASSLVIRMDMLMTFFIVLSLYTFFRIYKNEHAKRDKYLLPVYIFLAIFSKGPMGFLIPTASIIAFLIVKKQIRSFGRYLGWKQWGILTGLCMLWFLFIYIEGGTNYLNNILFKQTIGRAINSFHHKEPIWFYLPRFLWSFAPWSILYIMLIWQGIKKRLISPDTEKFFLVITVVNIIMLSLVSAKLDIYMLPIYPFTVYLSAILLFRNQQSKAVKAASALPAFLFVLFLPVFFFLKDNLPYQFENLTAIYAGLILIGASGLTALALLWKYKTAIKAIIVVSAGMLGMIFIISFSIPQFNKYIGFGEMAKSAKKNAEENKIRNFAYYKFNTAENMNIYINQQLECINSIGELDSFDNLKEKIILFVRHTEIRRDKEFGKWINLHHSEWSTGNYSWYIIGNQHDQNRNTKKQLQTNQ